MGSGGGSLRQRVSQAPIVHNRQQASRVLAELGEGARQDAALARLSDLLQQAPVRELLAGIFGASSFLTALIERDPARLLAAFASAPEARFEELCRLAQVATEAAPSSAEAMVSLRVFKAEVALLTALCDL